MHPARTPVGSARAIVLAVALVVALAGCSSTTDAAGPVAGSATAIAVDAPVTTLNPAAARTAPDAAVAALTGTGFFLPDATGAPVANRRFGTVVKLSDSPLLVRYSIRAGVTWSDGTPVTAADLLLQWAAAQPRNARPTGTRSTQTTNGTVDFGSAGVTTPLAAATTVPTVSSDGRSLTVRFDRPITAWRTAFGSTPSAAATYGLAKLGLAKGRDAQAAVVQAIQRDDRTTLAAFGTAWRTGFAATTMPDDPAALVSDGPYVVSQIVAGQFITLAARAGYDAGPAPRLARITVRVIPQGKAQVEALQNGQVDLISGPATMTTITGLQGVTDTHHDTAGPASTEYLQLSPDNGGPFDAATYGSNSTRAREVRKAFLHVIPRAKLVSTLFAAPAPKVAVANSQTFLPAEAAAPASISGNGSAAYRSVDAAAARDLLSLAGARLPVTVRLAVPTGDVGSRAFRLISRAADAAGFRVVATSAGEASEAPDATIAASLSTLDDAGRTAPLFTTGGAQNARNYANSAVDAAYRQLTTETNTPRRTALLQRIDGLVWADAVSMPLFARTEVIGTADSLTGVVASSLGVTVAFWNWRETTGLEKPDD